jgi:hypothetical protein
MSPSGVALYASTDAGTAEATEYSDTVSDDDFRLPG